MLMYERTSKDRKKEIPKRGGGGGTLNPMKHFGPIHSYLVNSVSQQPFGKPRMTTRAFVIDSAVYRTSPYWNYFRF